MWSIKPNVRQDGHVFDTDRIRLRDLMMGYATGRWFSSSNRVFAKKQDRRLPTSMMLTASNRDQGEPSRHRTTIVVGRVRATHGRMPGGAGLGHHLAGPTASDTLRWPGRIGSPNVGESLFRDEGNNSTGAGFAKTQGKRRRPKLHND
jgi:hypothetical protein